MNIRAARKFQATRGSTAIAVAFSILSGVLTFADGDSPQEYPAGMIQSATAQLWQSADDKETTSQYICML